MMLYLVLAYTVLSLLLDAVYGQITVDLSLVDDDGSVTTSKFTYTKHLDPADHDHFDLKLQIDSFCRSFRNAPLNCAESTYTEFMRIYKSNQPWRSEETILNSFSEDLAMEFCSSADGAGFASAQECYHEAVAAIRSVKLYNAFIRVHDLRSGIDHNTLVPMAASWEQGIEGHTFLYADKVRIMQELADDPRVERVCEIGFNLGHSTLNWLAANPHTSVLAFDVTRQAYTAAAINAINNLFPHRTVNLITGDSTRAVPNFARNTNYGVKCNVLFVDGAHDFETAFADIVNFRDMANTSFHRVFIDDISSPGVHQAVDEAVSRRVLYVHSVAPVNQTLCMHARKLQGGMFSGSYQFYRMSDQECEHPLESDYMQDQVVIGEYLF